MNILTVIPIYRNKFQKPALFFTQENFSIGSIILAPYSQSNNKKEKPVLIIGIDNSKNTKQFLRKTDIQINKTTNPYEFPFLSEEVIKDIETKTAKIKNTLDFSLEKIFTKTIKKELNKISEISEKNTIKNYSKKIIPDFISSKLKPFLPEKKEVKLSGKGVQSIGNLLSPQNNNKKSSLHSEKHYLVAEIREYFQETNKKGKGSFGFYLGFFKRIPENIIYQYWSEVKESRKSIKDQQKIFWWKIGQYLKKK
ncbi:MAG: hypothetical protein KAS02_00685 [Candidatus Pacebacteria bacterium]|nr:hypothetical protein [Candidatus Paceibacterota bacterium]